MATRKVNQPTLRLNSPELRFSTRLLNILNSNGVRTLKQLLRRKHSELLLLRGFGATMEHEVREKLAQLGLKLKDDPKSYERPNPCPLCGCRKET